MEVNKKVVFFVKEKKREKNVQFKFFYLMME